MCKECGCGDPGKEPARVHGDEGGHDHSHAHPHDHDHDHPHDHPHPHSHPHSHPHVHGHGPQSGAGERRLLEVRRSALEKNDRVAERNRGFFHARGLLVLNVLSSPGSGKTTLLQETLKACGPELKAAVVVGDLATDNDARRLREAGVPVIQVTTGTVCHLEAEMLARAIGQLDLTGVRLLIVENVGNLVCPASYDLGESLRVVLLSVTEGEDKPLKYPPMFQSADVAILSKTDLAAACAWDRKLALSNLKKAAPRARVFELSARTGDGMTAWCDFLREQSRGVQPGLVVP